MKKHDLLQFTDTRFDRDYVEFNVRVSDVETTLQYFVNHSFESISSIEASLKQLDKFMKIFHRENLKTDLDSKYTLLFHAYGLDLLAVQVRVNSGVPFYGVCLSTGPVDAAGIYLVPPSRGGKY